MGRRDSPPSKIKRDSKTGHSLPPPLDRNKIRDPMGTPKPGLVQEVHQMTIMEENETVRASVDKGIKSLNSRSKLKNTNA